MRRDWAIRCMHEAQLHEANAFITLTYDEAHTPDRLDYTDFQRFMYRIRKKKGPVRYFAAGEYGKENNRPHWHAILFGCAFEEPTQLGAQLYRSTELEELWTKGYSSIGNVTYESAAYVAKYIVKKAARQTVDLATGEIEQLKEIGHMSTNPGIGAKWLEKYWPEVYEARDAITLKGGTQMKPPRYYDKRMNKMNEIKMEEKKEQRKIDAEKNSEERTEQKLREKEKYSTEMNKRQKAKI
jgi:hypothetical protein